MVFTRKSKSRSDDLVKLENDLEIRFINLEHRMDRLEGLIRPPEELSSEESRMANSGATTLKLLFANGIKRIKWGL